MAIKSFQGKRVVKKKSSPNRLLVSDIMSHKLVLFTPDESIHDVMKKFIKYRVSGGPVVNSYGKLVGIISEADCMKEISDSRYFNMPILDKTVKHFMTNNVQTIDVSTSVFDAASLFFKTKKRRFPVINKDKLVGQISRKDIVIAALNMKSQTWR